MTVPVRDSLSNRALFSNSFKNKPNSNVVLAIPGGQMYAGVMPARLATCQDYAASQNAGKRQLKEKNVLSGRQMCASAMFARVCQKGELGTGIDESQNVAYAMICASLPPDTAHLVVSAPGA